MKMKEIDKLMQELKEYKNKERKNLAEIQLLKKKNQNSNVSPKKNENRSSSHNDLSIGI